MGAEDISFEDLVADEPACAAPPATFEQLLADGFPHRGGLAVLAAIEQMQDPGPHLAAVRQAYLQLVKMQRREV
jgi:hypothetical protein